MRFNFHPKQSLAHWLEQIRQIRDAPHAVAGGVALGMFWGFTPLTGLKTLLSVFFAWLFRCSKLSAALAVALHDVLTPIWPVVLRWEYQLGFWLITHPHRFPPRLALGNLHWDTLFHWRTLAVLGPTCLGSLLFGLPAAAISYWTTERTLRHYEGVRNRRLKLEA